MKKSLIVLGVLVLVIVVINLIYENKRYDELMKNSENTNATIVDFGGSKGACIIMYVYFVKGTKFEGRKYIPAMYCNDEYIGLKDLEIIYAVEDPRASEVVDDRFR